MLSYIVRRLLYMVILLITLSVVVFAIIQLPPGDYLTAYLTRMRLQGQTVDDEARIETLKKQYYLDLPVYMQYLKWVGGLLRGNLGKSFYWDRPIADLLAERLPLTVSLSFATLVLSLSIAIPVGVYAATHQNSFADYAVNAIAFLSIGTPDFLLALLVMFWLNRWFGISVGGIFSPAYRVAPWSIGRVLDMLKHMIAPAAIIGLSGTAGTIRVMRANMLDELRKPYVTTARSKGLTERRLLLKYPLRIALNPVLSTLGWSLPGIFSGSTIVSMVLVLPTVGPLQLDALRSQDYFVAGSIVMILTVLTLIGTLISDILLAVADPRVRTEGGGL
jgi:peptide/nickel transport system permease protein